MRNIPNVLTILRIFLTFIFIFFITQNGILPILMATIFFTLAALTDFYDGYFAKKHKSISNFGKIMDPIADKFLILAAFFSFVHLHLVALWMVILIFLRETVITVLRLWAIHKGQILAAEKEGKQKTVLQFVAISAILMFMIFREARISPYGSTLEVWWFISIYVLMLFTVGLTLSSGISYLWRNRKLMYLA